MELISKKIINERIEIYKLTDLLRVKKIYRHNKLSSVTLEGKGPHDSYPMVVKSNFWDFIKTKNPYNQYKGIDSTKPNEMIYGWDIITYKDKKTNDFDYDQLLKDNLIIFCYNSGHVLFDLKGDPIPIPHYFDYIGTLFENTSGDIEKMLPILKKHKWTLEPEKLKIKEVPYYNNESGNKKFIDGVQLLPSKKEYIEMYKLAIQLAEKNKSRAEFWSCTLKDLMKGNSYEMPSFDPLKIHKFLNEDNSFHPDSKLYKK